MIKDYMISSMHMCQTTVCLFACLFVSNYKLFFDTFASIISCILLSSYSFEHTIITIIWATPFYIETLPTISFSVNLVAENSVGWCCS